MLQEALDGGAPPRCLPLKPNDRHPRFCDIEIRLGLPPLTEFCARVPSATIHHRVWFQRCRNGISCDQERLVPANYVISADPRTHPPSTPLQRGLRISTDCGESGLSGTQGTFDVVSARSCVGLSNPGLPTNWGFIGSPAPARVLWRVFRLSNQSQTTKTCIHPYLCRKAPSLENPRLHKLSTADQLCQGTLQTTTQL
jgi:hypothetical protein